MEIETLELATETKSKKAELIDAIKNSDDDVLIAKLWFQIKPKEKVDRSWDNGLTHEEALALSLEKMNKWKVN